MDTTKLLSVQEAAEGLGLPQWKIYALVDQGLIPHKRLGGRIYFREVALVAWLEEGERESTRAGKEVEA